MITLAFWLAIVGAYLAVAGRCARWQYARFEVCSFYETLDLAMNCAGAVLLGLLWPLWWPARKVFDYVTEAPQ